MCGDHQRHDHPASCNPLASAFRGLKARFDNPAMLDLLSGSKGQDAATAIVADLTMLGTRHLTCEFRVSCT
jgi:hypothetical protein